jgi:outer membrane protein OmpA-like peptidoglycan-associated protein
VAKIESLSLYAIALMLATSLPTTVSAQSEDEVNRIIKGLAPIAGQTIAGQGDASTATSRTSGENLVVVTVERSQIRINMSYALDFSIYFEFDSAEFASSAYVQLSALGVALTSSELSNYRYLVAGHTDAVGTANYNRKLSEQRARAVRAYLLQNFPINPDRLISVGFGDNRLKSPETPKAAINRRVEIALIAD